MKIALAAVAFGAIVFAAGFAAWWFLLRDDEADETATAFVPQVARDEGLPDLPTLSPVPACNAQAVVKSWQRTSTPESLTIEGQGDMTGWSVISSPGDQRFNFPDGFTLDGTVAIYSGVRRFATTSTTLWWSADEVWDDLGVEGAYLYDCNGVLVHSKVSSP